MDYQEAKALHDLLFTFMGLFHEKFLIPFRRHDSSSWMKKNHIKILNILDSQDYLTSTEIGKKLDIEKGSLTALIDQLEAQGMVIRSSDCKDRRKTLISLSASGKEEIRENMDYFIRRLRDLLHQTDPAAINQFLFNLRDAVEFMKKL
jgi:DNA-binding MarR family transcriptional regulator